MVYKTCILFLLSILISSCGKKPDSNEKPVYNLPIPRQKMVDVLTDVYIAEAALLEYTTVTHDSMRKMFITQIFTIHQMDKNYFDSIQKILSLNIDLFNDVHQEVLDSINKPSVE